MKPIAATCPECKGTRHIIVKETDVHGAEHLIRRPCPSCSPPAAVSPGYLTK